MKFLFSYLKQRKSAIIIFVLFSGVFLCSFLLYHIPTGAVVYPAVLCGFFGSVLIFLDYRKIKNKHKLLSELCRYTEDITDNFPAAVTIDDADYQKIIRLLDEEEKQRNTEMHIRFSDMVDYYTLWAHQIKTPIAAMKLNLQNDDSELAGIISEDLFRIEQYVEMVLVFLRLDSDYTDYVIKEYSLDAIVKSAVKKFASQFIRRKITLVYEPLEANILTDEKWLSFVIEQVLSNALKYTKSGEISITLESPETLCIKDTGIGIAPEDLPRIFEKGFTGYNGREDKKASGIGLYLCQRICRNLGHTISAYSALGAGTEIRIGLNRESIEIE
ncbi:MAG: sensor histidine kinase [Eubacterium sp.]|nr:sensor histidine kinase [Eubacterium sp.]